MHHIAEYKRFLEPPKMSTTNFTERCIKLPATTEKHPSKQRAELLARIAEHPTFWTLLRCGYWGTAFSLLGGLIRDTISGTNGATFDILSSIELKIVKQREKIRKLRPNQLATEDAIRDLKRIEEDLQKSKPYADSAGKAIETIEKILTTAEEAIQDRKYTSEKGSASESPEQGARPAQG